MQTIPLHEAQTRLAEIVAQLPPGGEVVLTDDGRPAARLVKEARTSWPCKAGSAKDTPHWMAPGFDAPLEDFAEGV
jgi:antitoxin (DNA-binding transcriptional repressor) of toxin-antitoxin stability system